MSNSLPSPSKRRRNRTPEPIRTFVAQRAAAGMPLDLLAQLVGVGYQTVLSWCKNEVIAHEGNNALTASQLRKRNKQLETTQSQLMKLEKKRSTHDAHLKSRELEVIRYEARLAKNRSILVAQKLEAVRNEQKKVKETIRTKGLQILLEEKKENLAELKRLSLQQADFRKRQKELVATTNDEITGKHLEMAHGIVAKVRALNPTAMNLQRIAAELGITVEDIFAAYRLTNQRFKP